MRRTNILLIALFALSAQSCRDNFEVETPSGRNYQQDVTVLNDFVDINKNMYEYYINPNQHNSPLAYVTHSDTEELYAVNPLNLDMFKENMERVNSLTKEASLYQSVDYIVMMTSRQIYINKIKKDSPIEFKQAISNGQQAPVKTSIDVTRDIAQQTFYENYNYVQTSIQLNPQAYHNIGWAFYINCETRKGNTEETARILFCGIGYHNNPCFDWKWIDQPYNTATEWNFTITSGLTDSNFAIAKVNFLQP